MLESIWIGMRDGEGDTVVNMTGRQINMFPIFRNSV